jgi:type IV pilus biogenesis protein CpaD/CtpE
MPIASDLRDNWVRVWLDAIDAAEMRELVVDAWHMVVSKRIAADYLRDIRERLRGCGCPSVPARTTKSAPLG